jgi:hypothetical protein
MSKPKTHVLPILAALSVMSFALPAFAQPEISPANVTGKAPETVRLDVTGADFATVRPMVHQAAATVCRNAVSNHDITFVDETWCSETAAYKAMRQFAVIVSHRNYADSGVIVLSAR